MNNPLRSLSNIFKKKEDDFVGLDIGTSAIKAVQLKRKGGKAVLETYGSVALGPYASADVGALTNLENTTLGQAISDLLRESNVTTKTAAISIPSASSLVTVIKLPHTVSGKQFSSVVPLEARKYIPLPISEVSLDWWPMPRRETTEESALAPHEILVTAVHNEILSRYRELAKAASLRADFLEIEIFSNVRSIFGQELGSVLVIDWGASKTRAVVFKHGNVKSFHIINRGAVDLTNNLMHSMSMDFKKAEEIKHAVGLSGTGANRTVSDTLRPGVDYILSEVAGVVFNYGKQYNETVNKVVLTGGGALLKGLQEHVAERLRTEVSLADPFAKTENTLFLSETLFSAGPEFSIATGLALRKLKEGV